jgi:hypothetical protein
MVRVSSLDKNKLEMEKQDRKEEEKKKFFRIASKVETEKYAQYLVIADNSNQAWEMFKWQIFNKLSKDPESRIYSLWEITATEMSALLLKELVEKKIYMLIKDEKEK